MTAADLLSGGFKLLAAASPFVLIQFIILYADQMIELLKRSILGRSRGGY